MKSKTKIHTVVLLVTAGLLKMATCPVLYSEPVGQEIIPVVIGPDSSNPNGDPRGPVFNPFTAYLQGNNVVLNCSVYYGDVVVVLVSTAGDYYTTVFDTSDGSTVIPISNLSGDYTLCLTDASGMQFIGEFNV